jgi:hypothetical protein
VNEEFVDQGAFESRVLKEGDEVEFLYFMGGGTIMRSIIQDGSDFHHKGYHVVVDSL